MTEVNSSPVPAISAHGGARFLNRQALGLALTAVVAVTVVLTTLMPSAYVPGPPGGDKTMHLLAFAALTLPTACLAHRHLTWVLPFAIVLGAAIEIIQPAFGRHRELADLYADSAGALAGVGVGLMCRALLGRLGLMA